MKKLSLGEWNFNPGEVLDKSSMALIYGGNVPPPGGGCVNTITCNDGTQFSGSGECPSSSTACDNNGGLDRCVHAGC